MRSTLGERVFRVVTFGFLATILDEFCREISARREIGEHAPCGLCDIVGRPHQERSLALIEVKCKKVPAINVQALPNFGR
jgi:hypothetical protein